MTDKKNPPNLNELAQQAVLLDSNSIVLDPAKAIEWWNEGRKWRATSVFLGLALMWLPFAGLYAMVRQFVPQAHSILNTACPGVLIGFAVAMTLTLLKRPILFVIVLLYSLGLIFCYTLLFVWVMNLFADRSTQFIAGFIALGVAVAVATLSNRILKIVALRDLVESK